MTVPCRLLWYFNFQWRILKNPTHFDPSLTTTSFKEDLHKGNGRSVAGGGPGYTYWIKTFSSDDVPIKIVYVVDMPFATKVFAQLLDPRNIEAPNDWEHEVLEKYPDDGGHVTYMRAHFTESAHWLQSHFESRVLSSDKCLYNRRELSLKCFVDTKM